MAKQAQGAEVKSYLDAITILSATGVLTTDDRFRDGHTEASFAAASIDVTGSSLTQRKVDEKESMRLFGHLLAAAADRGLRPAELLAIGMATVLKDTAKA